MGVGVLDPVAGVLAVEEIERRLGLHQIDTGALSWDGDTRKFVSIPDREFYAVLSNDPDVNNSPTIQAKIDEAAAEGGGFVWVVNPNITGPDPKIKTTLVGASNVGIGCAAGCRLDATDIAAPPPVGQQRTTLAYTGTVGTTYTCPADVVKGQYTIPMPVGWGAANDALPDGDPSKIEPGDWIEVFTEGPWTYLDAFLSTTDTTVVLRDASNFAEGMKLRVGNEVILLGAKSGNTFTGCTRGLSDGAAAAKHNLNNKAYEYNFTKFYPSWSAVVDRGEHKRVRALRGDQLRLEQANYDDYPSTGVYIKTASVRKVNFVENIDVSKFSAYGTTYSADQDYGILLTRVNGFRVRDYELDNYDVYQVSTNSCIRGEVVGGRGRMTQFDKGVPWVGSTQYYPGDVVTPTPPNGYFYTCVSAGVSGGANPGGTNVVPNGSFETDVSGWSSSLSLGGPAATITRDTGWSSTGSASLRWTITRTDGAGVSVHTAQGTDGMPVTPGETVFAEMDLFVRSIAGGNLSVLYSWYQADGSPSAILASTKVGTDLGDTDEQARGGGATVPADAVFCAIGLYWTNEPIGVSALDVNIDNVVLYRGVPSTSPVWTTEPGALVTDNTVVWQAGTGGSSFYGIITFNACQWINVIGNHGDRMRHLHLCTASGAGAGYHGQARFINVIANHMVNAEAGSNNRSWAFEHHGTGEGIIYAFNHVDGCYVGFNIEGGDVLLLGNRIVNWWFRGIYAQSDNRNYRRIFLLDNEIGPYSIEGQGGISGADATSRIPIELDMSKVTDAKSVVLRNQPITHDLNQGSAVKLTTAGAVRGVGVTIDQVVTHSGAAEAVNSAVDLGQVDNAKVAKLVVVGDTTPVRTAVKGTGAGQTVRDVELENPSYPTTGNAINLTGATCVVEDALLRKVANGVRSAGAGGRIKGTTAWVNTGGSLITSDSSGNVIDSDNQDLNATLPVIASAALLGISLSRERQEVSGSTTITSLPSSWAGRKIELVFTGTAQVTRGNNLDILGNFSGGAGRSLRLIYTNAGTWRETGRTLDGTATYQDFFYRRRSSEMSTLPRTLSAATIGTITSGSVYAGLATALSAGTFTKIRFATGAGTPSGITDARGIVWNSDKTLKTDTGNKSTTVTLASTVYELTLSSSVVVAQGDELFLGVGFVASTTPTIRGYAGFSGQMSIAPIFTGTAPGWTANTNPPTLNDGGGPLPWAELIA